MEGGNGMSVLEMQPKDVLEDSWIEEYERNMDAIWWQLRNLSANVFILGKISSFPFDLFVPEPPPRHFWTRVENALVDSSVLAIWRVAVDNSNSEGLTLQQIKNGMVQNFRRPEHMGEFTSALKCAAFGKTLSALDTKIELLRHNYIAHFNRQRNTSPTPEQVEESYLVLPELEGYRDSVNSCFKLLGLGCERLVPDLEYHPGVQLRKVVDSRSDIERLLDAFAKDSDVLNMPEADPLYWSSYVGRLSEDELKTLNVYRAKFDLGAV